MKSFNLRKRFTTSKWYLKVTVVIGILLIILSVLGSLGYKYLRAQGEAYDKESKAYVDKLVPAVFANWDTDELYKYTSPEYESSTKRDDTEYFMELSKEHLGLLEVYQGSQGESLTFINNINGKKVWGKYVANMVYEKGRADIDISLIYTDGRWYVYGFKVISPVFEKLERRDLIPEN